MRGARKPRIIALAGELVADFHHVRDDFDRLNRELREQFWDDSAPVERDSFPLPPEPEAPEPVAKASRWRPLLAGLAQLVGWWLQRKPRRPALRRVLMVGTVVGLTTVVAGPLVGAVVMALGAALLLARVGDGSSQAVGRLPTVPVP
jgi:hypothetical protein